MKSQTQIHDVREHSKRYSTTRVRRDVREAIILQLCAQIRPEPQRAVNQNRLQVPVLPLRNLIHRRLQRDRRRDVRHFGREQKYDARREHHFEQRLILRPQVRQQMSQVFLVSPPKRLLRLALLRARAGGGVSGSLAKKAVSGKGPLVGMSSRIGRMRSMYSSTSLRVVG